MVSSRERIALILSGQPVAECADGRRVALHPGLASLLAWLALEGPSSRQRLVGLLWPESDPGTARNALRQRLFQVKKKTGIDLVTGTTVLSLAVGVTHDLGGGSGLLADLEWPECPDFNAWLHDQRALRLGGHRQELAQRAEALELAGDASLALPVAESLLRLEPLSEDAHRRVIRLHYLRGDRSAALLAFDRCEKLLKDEVGTTPSTETLALLDALERRLPLTGQATNLLPSLLRPPRLIGRADELARLTAAWEQGRAFVVIAHEGMGKTRLLHEFATARDDTVMVAARPGDAHHVHSLAKRLLRELSLFDRARAMTTAPPAAHDGPAGAPIVAATNSQSIRDALLSSMARAHEHGRSAILIDDVHHADPASIDILVDLHGFSSRLGWRLGLAHRPLRPDASAMLARLYDVHGAGAALVSLTLPPLTAHHVHELLESLAVSGLEPARFAAPLARHTGGNPLFALQTLLAMPHGSTFAEVGSLPTSATTAATLERRLRLLTAPALALARVCAIAGSSFSPELAVKVLEVRAVDLADPWAELEAEHVMHRGGFASDLVAAATVRTLPVPVAGQMHAAVAAYLETAGGDAAAIARHWLEARQNLRAIPHLRRAAHDALQRFERPAAAALLELAATALVDAGAGDDAFRVQGELCSLLQGFDSGRRHDEASQRLVGMARTPLQLSHAHTLRAIYHHIVGEAEPSLREAATAVEHAERAGDDAALAQALNARGVAQRRSGHLPEARLTFDLALQAARRTAGDPTADLPSLHNNLGLVLMEMDQQQDAVLQFEQSAQLQADPLTRARILANLAISHDELGAGQRALQTRQQSLALLATQAGSEFARFNVMVGLAASLRQLHRHAEGLDALDEARALVGSIRHFRIENLEREGARAWLDLGCWDQAEACMQRLDAMATDSVPERLAALLVKLRVRIAREQRADDLLEQVHGLMRQVDEPRSRRRIVQLRLRTIAPLEALALALVELQSPQSEAHMAINVPLHALAARSLLALDRDDEALRHTQAAMRGHGLVQPLDFSWFEVRHLHRQALSATGDNGTADFASSLAHDLREVAERSVPLEWRRSFMQGVVLHRQILAVARVSG